MPKYAKIIEDLIKKNRELELKLLHASEWMQKDLQEKKDVVNGNIHEIHTKEIKDTIHSFFENFPIVFDKDTNIFDELLSSEILYHHLESDPSIDGTGVIIGYTKVLEYIIDKNITLPYREFAKQNSQDYLKSRKTLEKKVYQTVYKWYILSIGRLYEVLEAIKINSQNSFFVELFKKFLENNPHIKKILLDEIFLEKIQSLIEKDMFWWKRHSGEVTLEDCREVREKCMGNFSQVDCIIIHLLNINTL